MSAPVSVRLRRTYFDCRFGQLHVHQAIPPGGGFDEATALLCLPDARGLGSFFLGLLAPLGVNRSIYAPDLPGCGGSDSPVTAAGGLSRASPEQCAQAMIDLLDSLRQRRVDVLAHAEGAEIALALVAQRPALVHRLAWSAPGASVRERAQQAGLATRDFALSDPAAPDAAQLQELLEFLGAGART